MESDTFHIAVAGDSIRIYINELLHLYIKRNLLVGIQSWVMEDAKNRYAIEYTTTSGSIICEYDDVEKWKAVLLLLEENILLL